MWTGLFGSASAGITGKAAGDAGGLGLAMRGKRLGRQTAGLIDVTSNLSPVLL